MNKRYFVLAGLLAGLLGVVGSGSSFAAAGNSASITGGDWDICVTTGASYSGSSFVASISATGFESQFAIGDFVNEGCRSVKLPQGNYTVNMSMPQGVSGMSYMTSGNKLSFTPTGSVARYISNYGSLEYIIAATGVEIQFDANGGTGLMSPIHTTINTSETLTSNSFSRAGYDFVEWNTEPDGSGDSYSDGGTASFDTAGDHVLYAQWRVRVALLASGPEVNLKLRKLAGVDSWTDSETGETYYYSDWTVKSIEQASELPASFDTTDEDSIISDENSTIPIYAWYEPIEDDPDDAAIMKVYSTAGQLKGNTDMSEMFKEFYYLEDVPVAEIFDTSDVVNMESIFEIEDSANDRFQGMSRLQNWDVSSVENMKKAFSGRDIDSVDALENWDVSSVEDMSDMFSYNYSLSDLSALENWDVSSVKTMRNMFASVGSYDNDVDEIDLSPLSKWNTSSLEDVSFMFYYSKVAETSALESQERDGYTSWDTSNLKTMEGLFSYNSTLTSIEGLESWDVSNVENMASTFDGTSISDLSPIKDWNIENVTTLKNTFFGTRIEDLDQLADWDTEGVLSMESTFERADLLTDIDGISGWDVSDVTTMKRMFDATAITTLDALENWDVSSVEDMSYMFSSGYRYTNESSIWRSQLADISKIAAWNTSSLKNIDGMFWGSRITSAEPLRTTQHDGYTSWDISPMESIKEVFYGAEYLEDIDALSTWDVSNVKNMQYTFFYTRVSNATPIAEWNTSSLTNSSYMFSNLKKAMTNTNTFTTTQRDGYVSWDMSSVRTIEGMFEWAYVEDISGIANWNTSSVRDMSSAFVGLRVSSLTPLATTQRNGYTSWDVSNVEDMAEMFRSSSITSIAGISNWNTSKVTSMYEMFFAASSLSDVGGLATTQRDNYTSWDVSKVKSFYGMFYNAAAMSNINALSTWNIGGDSSVSYVSLSRMFSRSGIVNVNALSSWNTGKVTNMSQLFEECLSLTNLSGITGWDVSKVTNMSYMFRNSSSLTNLQPIFGWTLKNPKPTMTQMFKNVPASTLPSWYS